MPRTFVNRPFVLATTGGFVSFKPTTDDCTRWAVTLLSYGPEDLEDEARAVEAISSCTETPLCLEVVCEALAGPLQSATVWRLQSAEGVPLSANCADLNSACKQVLKLSLLEWLAVEERPDAKTVQGSFQEMPGSKTADDGYSRSY